ncbi:hypothetical protein N8261_03585 [Flavobacteriaceae bacterium]|nr:hypothetical protein [Flavobacteriaceae bacterium]
MESEIFYLHRGEDYNELAEMEHYIDEIKKSAQYALCGGKIGKDFIDSSLDNSTFLFVHKYGDDIRGFATIQSYTDTEGVAYLYIDLICNSEWGMSTRSSNPSARAGAKHIIEKVIELGRHMNVGYIKLNAIEDVIGYYWRLGFRFPGVERITRATDLVAELRTAQLRGDDDNVDKIMNDIILRYYPGHFSELKQKELSTEEGKQRIQYGLDTGIPMIIVLGRRGGRKYKKSRKRKNSKKGKGKKSRKGKGKKSRKVKSRKYSSRRK